MPGRGRHLKMVFRAAIGTLTVAKRYLRCVTIWLIDKYAAPL
jgi:hypothetical protein